jgi:predicted AlkP superfamily pyrophosphatase or phosphodiesterase
MKSLTALWLILTLASASPIQADTAAGKPPRPIPEVEHVVLISIDGLRPDLALRANMPTLRGMLREGAYSFWTRTTALSLTLPSHTSMTTGVIPDKHGITWNRDLPFSQPVYPRRPTVMEMATQAGYVSAMVTGKSKFSTLNKPGTIMYAIDPAAVNSASDDRTVATEAEKLIAAHQPDLLFIHFPDVDGAGHGDGWGSNRQIATIEKTDGQLARIFAALDRADIRSSTLVILSADHGGAGLTHGADDARSRHIPWIAVGPGVKRGYDLTQLAELEVRTEDSAATICYLLGLPQPAYFDGKPVLAAFENPSP